MPDDESPEEALYAELQNGFFKNYLILLDLMASAPLETHRLYQPRIHALKERSDRAVSTMEAMPEGERLSWGLANLEQTNEELGKLIRKIRERLKP